MKQVLWISFSDLLKLYEKKLCTGILRTNFFDMIWILFFGKIAGEKNHYRPLCSQQHLDPFIPSFSAISYAFFSYSANNFDSWDFELLNSPVLHKNLAI